MRNSYFSFYILLMHCFSKSTLRACFKDTGLSKRFGLINSFAVFELSDVHITVLPETIYCHIIVLLNFCVFIAIIRSWNSKSVQTKFMEFKMVYFIIIRFSRFCRVTFARYWIGVAKKHELLEYCNNCFNTTLFSKTMISNYYVLYMVELKF